MSAGQGLGWGRPESWKAVLYCRLAKWGDGRGGGTFPCSWDRHIPSPARGLPCPQPPLSLALSHPFFWVHSSLLPLSVWGPEGGLVASLLRTPGTSPPLPSPAWLHLTRSARSHSFLCLPLLSSEPHPLPAMDPSPCHLVSISWKSLSVFESPFHVAVGLLTLSNFSLLCR